MLAGLLEVEEAQPSAPIFKVRPYTGAAMEIPLLTVQMRLGWLGDQIH